MNVSLPLADAIVYPTALKGIDKAHGIYKSGFDEKELGTHAINTTLNCTVKCAYCSSESVLGFLKTYRDHVGDWWTADTLVFYQNVLGNVRRDAQRMCDAADAEVVFSTTVDPYQPPLVEMGFPREVLAALAPTRMKLRALSKLVAMEKDLPFIADNFGNRATVGTSIPILDEQLARVVEPFAPPPEARQRRILGRAKELGLRRYVMACPILPGVYPTYDMFAADWSRVVDTYEPERMWFEPINARGRNMDVLTTALEAKGLAQLAASVKNISSNTGWSAYNAQLLGWVQRFARERFETSRVRYLLYPHALTKVGKEAIEKTDGGCVIWL